MGAAQAERVMRMLIYLVRMDGCIRERDCGKVSVTDAPTVTVTRMPAALGPAAAGCVAAGRMRIIKLGPASRVDSLRHQKQYSAKINIIQDMNMITGAHWHDAPKYVIEPECGSTGVTWILRAASGELSDQAALTILDSASCFESSNQMIDLGQRLIHATISLFQVHMRTRVQQAPQENLALRYCGQTPHPAQTE
ncbi:hypothetical protein JB92DRAFT_3095093 [Gautieria morchelliformis]|nr:hypothetical protein JB92DRAFT_3095093 [Gautieria morchelliformis]